ncbi:hypothetical protein [Lentzea sp. CA-135723]|uniref:hypothetical protein n=1 Tax=Lentzea sp. CA-135723 TaxID=3239950 RepID=UPI003D8D60C7
MTQSFDPPPDATSALAPSDPAETTNLWQPRQVETPAPVSEAPDLTGDGAAINVTISGNFDIAGEINGVKVVNKVQATLEHLDADDAYLDLALRLFAPPEGFHDSYREWRNHQRLLVLAREPGSGRTTIAHALLATIRRESGQAIQVGALPFGGGETFPISRLPLEHRRWAYVVEVPPDEEDFTLRSRSFRMMLTSLGAELARRESWLIFLISPEQWASCVDETIAPMAAEIGQAEPAEIVRRALAVHEPDIDVERWLRASQITELLVGQQPTEVLDVVELIRSAHHADPGQLVAFQENEHNPEHGQFTDGGDRWFARRVFTVVEARRNWRKQLLAWHGKQGRTSLQRSFLLAAAALPDAPAAYVYALACKLNALLRDEKQQPSLAAFDTPGIIELVDAVEADLSHHDTVQFRHDGWDDAALHYFWTDRPYTRQHFIDWLADAPKYTDRSTFESLTGQQQRDLASRIARFAVHWATRQQRPEPLAKLADAWHGTPLWQVFVSALDEAAIQSSTHRYIHSMLLKWATKKDALSLWRAVAEVCGLEFGRRHTGKALRRLRHVAAVDDPGIEEAVQRSVITLWDDKSVRKTLFDMISSWCAGPATTSIARRAFGALAAKIDPSENVPALLVRGVDTDFTASSATLAVGWTVLLSPPRGEDAEKSTEATAHQWIDIALRRPELRDDVLEVLRNAVDHPEAAGRVSPRARLLHYLFTWHESGDGTDATERNDVYHQLTKLVQSDFARLLAGDGTSGTDRAA